MFYLLPWELIRNDTRKGNDRLTTAGKDLAVWHRDLQWIVSRIRYRIEPTQANCLQVYRFGSLFLQTLQGWAKFGLLHMMHDIQHEVYAQCAESLIEVSRIGRLPFSS